MPRPLAPLLLVTSVLLAACSRPEPVAEAVRAVRTTTVTVDSAGGITQYAADVRARTESRLSFRVAGKMVRRAVDAGQRVKAGELLAELDPEDLRLAQSAAQAAVQSSRVNFELAQADYQRFADLRQRNFISAAELERREAALKAARAQFEQAQAQAAVQVNQAGYAVLRAAVAGVVTAVEAEPGAVLAAGAPVLRLAHDGPRDAVFTVPEDAVRRLREIVGRPGGLHVRPWASSASWPATVREIAAAADPVTRTFLVKADLGTAEAQIGQTVTALLEQPRREGVIKLPLGAVMQQQGQTAVWLVDEATMTVRAQPIVVAGADGNEVVVASGLAPGQRVVTAGVHVLTPGQRVKLYVPAAAASATAR